MKRVIVGALALVALSANVNAAQKFECDMGFGGITPVTVTATTLTIDNFQAVTSGTVISYRDNGDVMLSENYEYRGAKYNMLFRLTAANLATPKDATPEVKAEIERKNKEEKYSVSVFEDIIYWKGDKRVDADGKPLTETQIKGSSRDFVSFPCRKVS